MMLFVGVGLWAFYRAFPDRLAGEALAAVSAKTDKIFPVFILTEVPMGLRGLIVAGIFAAAISSLTSILAALAQTTISAVYLPWRGIDLEQNQSAEQNRELLWISRGLIVFWGIALCIVAVAIDLYVDHQAKLGREVLLLELALGLANYIVGSLFAAFLLAWLPLRTNAYGLIWSAPLSVFCVLASRFHNPECWFVLRVVSAVLIVAWLISAIFQKRPWVLGAKTIWLAAGCALMLAITRYLQFDQFDPESGQLALSSAGEPLRSSIAWPWYAPLGGMVALVFGYLLGEPLESR